MVSSVHNGTAEVALTRGKVAIVDAADLQKASHYKWHAVRGRTTWYAMSNDENRKKILLHRYLADCPEGLVVDHRDGNGLNNIRDNLRLANYSQNAFNSKKSRRATKSTSRYKGVAKAADKFRVKRWRASIRSVDSRRKHLGYFATEEEAARAYDDAAKQLHGEFPILNFN